MKYCAVLKDKAYYSLTRIWNELLHLICGRLICSYGRARLALTIIVANGAAVRLYVKLVTETITNLT